MKEAKALIYFVLGLMMCWSALRQGNYWMAVGIAFFVLCAISITLMSIGQTKITWDELGITLKKRPKPAVLLNWSDIQTLKVDHLGYHIKTNQTGFRVSKNNMPKELLQKIRASIRENSQTKASLTRHSG